MRDYFTRAEFETFAGVGAGTYDPDDIDAAQAEVIDHLEKWARSAWPNVTGTTGDGTAATARTTTEIFDGPAEAILLSHVPLIAVSTFEVDESAVVDGTDYYAYAAEGELRFVGASGAYPRGIEVTYTYGHTSTPWAIKRAAMLAMKSLLTQKAGKSKVPGNVSRHTTEGTTFEFNQEDEDKRPWPWDDEASESVRSYWGSDRPMNVGAV